MARDYASTRYKKQSKKKPAKRKKSQSKKQSMHPFILSSIWLVIGMLIGSFGSTLLFLSHPQQQPQIAKAEQKTENKTAIAKKEVANEKSPQFDFYTILPEKNVEVQKTENTTKEQTIEKSHYVLQVASVKQSKDAERLKAQLILLGFTVYVTDPEATNSSWYRVNVGPFDSLSDARKQQKQLRANNLNSLLVTLKQQA